MRARDAAGQWSPVGGIAVRSRPAAVFVHDVAPRRVEPGPVVFVIRGLGLAAATQVRFHTGAGTFTAASLTHDGAQLRAVASVTADWAGAVTVEVVAAAGSDALAGWLAAALPEEPADTVPPQPVTDLAADVVDSTSVLLTWTAPGDSMGPSLVPAAFYELRRFDPEAGESYAVGVPLPPPDPSAPGAPQSTLVRDLPPGAVVAFQVVAFDDARNASAPSNRAEARLPAPDVTAPAAPAGLEAGRFGGGRVQLRWRASGDDGDAGLAAGYALVLRDRPDPGTAWWEAETPAPLDLPPRPAGKRLFYNVGELEGGAVYGFALRATDDAGNASPWSVVYLYVDGALEAAAAPPAAPGGLAGTLAPGGVVLTWEPAPEANVARYVVQRSEPGGEAWEIGAVPVALTEFVDPDPLPGDCRYSVLSETADGVRSAFPRWVTVTVPGSDALTVTPTASGWSLTTPASGTPESAPPVLAIFDVSGRLVASPEPAPAAGGWTAAWDGRDARGRAVPRGVVFVRLQREGATLVRKILVAR